MYLLLITFPHPSRNLEKVVSLKFEFLNLFIGENIYYVEDRSFHAQKDPRNQNHRDGLGEIEEEEP